MPLEILHITAAYSNAVLVAVMPHVTEFVKKLDLPIPLPINQSQVSKFNVSPVKSLIGGGLWLTNHYQFVFENGAVSGFRIDPNYFTDETFPLPIDKYTGKDNMTTNEAVQMARDAIQKLGYNLKDLYADTPPASVKGPFDSNDGKHIPYCEIRWIKEPETLEDKPNSVYLEFQINLEAKQIVGMSLASPKLWRQNPVIDVVPENEIEFRRKQQSKVTFSTNAPKSILKKPATQLQQSETNAIKLNFR